MLMEKLIHLQGIGDTPAKFVSELSDGDVIVKNYGYKYRVLELNSISSNAYELILESLNSVDPGCKYNKNVRGNTLIGFCESPESFEYVESDDSQRGREQEDHQEETEYYQESIAQKVFYFMQKLNEVRGRIPSTEHEKLVTRILQPGKMIGMNLRPEHQKEYEKVKREKIKHERENPSSREQGPKVSNFNLKGEGLDIPSIDNSVWGTEGIKVNSRRLTNRQIKGEY